MDLGLTKEQIFDIKKFMAFVLRHKPYFYHVKLDSDGFAQQKAVLRAIAKNKKIVLTPEQLEEICKRHSGGIFVVSGTKVRARDGHTITLNMKVPDGYVETSTVPNRLFCSIAQEKVGGILLNGGLSLGDAQAILTKTEQIEEGKRVVIINAHKAISGSIKFYHNPVTDTYYARHIAARYLSAHV